MVGTFDDKLMLVDSTANVTATATGDAVDFNGEDLYPLTLRVVVPSVSGTSPTLNIEYQESSDNSNWSAIGSMPEITAAGEYYKRFWGKKRYRRAKMTVAGTSPNFGFVKIGISAGGD